MASYEISSQARFRRLLLAGAGLMILVLFGLTITGIIDHTWWQVVILGIVEGVTEFLPISSTAHLLITADLLGFQNSVGGTFEIFIQFGATLAVILYYARDLVSQTRRVMTEPGTRRLWLGVVIAFLPAAIAGLLLRDWIKRVLFESPPVIAAALIIGGLVLIAVEQVFRSVGQTRHLEQISLRQSFAIGLAQTLALIPGVSRSGAAIIGGRLAGLDRPTATAFSFYLAIPTLGAATLVDLISSLDRLSHDDISRLVIGTVVAFIAAWLSIDWLLGYVARHSFVVFGIYRVIAGIIVLLLAAVGRL